MRTYYLFIIKDNLKQMYKNNSNSLYKKLELFNSKNISLNYKMTIYNQICNVYNKDIIINYLNKLKFLKNNNNKFLYKSKDEISLFEFNCACCLIITNKNLSYFFKFLNYYTKNIFVSDFKNNDYFWLESMFAKNKSF